MIVAGALRPATTAPQHGAAAQWSAANAGSDMFTAELTRLNTDLFSFYWAPACLFEVCPVLNVVLFHNTPHDCCLGFLRSLR